MSRIVGHLDLDYFYAQVEEVETPSLKDTPVVVCVFSGRSQDSGVVSTSNYKAREYGVKSGIPIALARRHLNGIAASFIPMDHGKYEVYSDRVMAIVKSEVDVLEQTGVDEAFFDATDKVNRDYGLASALALRIKRRVLEEERLTCSIGLGPNKVIAKIASDFKKPDGLTVVTSDKVASFLFPLPVAKIYGVGPKTSSLLADNGIARISDLVDTPVERLQDLLGRRLAVYLSSACKGADGEPVVNTRGISQLSRIVTLKDDADALDQIMAAVTPTLHDLHEKLLSRDLFFRTVSAIGILKDLSIHTKSKTFETPTNDYAMLDTEVRELFTQLTRESSPLRRVGVRLGELRDMVDQRSLTDFTG